MKTVPNLVGPDPEGGSRLALKSTGGRRADEGIKAKAAMNKMFGKSRAEKPREEKKKKKKKRKEKKKNIRFTDVCSAQVIG